MNFIDKRDREIIKLYRVAAKRGLKRRNIFFLKNGVLTHSPKGINIEILIKIRKSIIEKYPVKVQIKEPSCKKRVKHLKTTYVPIGMGAYGKGGKKK